MAAHRVEVVGLDAVREGARRDGDGDGRGDHRGVVLGDAGSAFLVETGAHGEAGGHEEAGSGAVAAGEPLAAVAGDAAVLVVGHSLAQVGDVAGGALRVVVLGALDEFAVLVVGDVHDRHGDAGDRSGLVADARLHPEGRRRPRVGRHLLALEDGAARRGEGDVGVVDRGGESGAVEAPSVRGRAPDTRPLARAASGAAGHQGREDDEERPEAAREPRAVAVTGPTWHVSSRGVVVGRSVTASP